MKKIFTVVGIIAILAFLFVILYFTKNSNEWIFNKFHNQIFKSKLKPVFKSIKSEITVISPNDIGHQNELEKLIVSHFSNDWKITVSRMYFSRKDIVLSRISDHKIRNYLV